MKNSTNMEFTEEKIMKIGYIVICGILGEILASGKRIAIMKELRCIKMLIDPSYIDMIEDLELLKILDEPHVKLASELADFTCDEILQPYASMNYLDDDEVMEDEWATDMGQELLSRYLFYRENPLRRDRYINFSKVLKTSQRTVYEFLKLMITGETRMLDLTYRTNYSPGRLKALVANTTDPVIIMLVGLIEKLKAGETKCNALTVL